MVLDVRQNAHVRLSLYVSRMLVNENVCFLTGFEDYHSNLRAHPFIPGVIYLTVVERTEGKCGLFLCIKLVTVET